MKTYLAQHLTKLPENSIFVFGSNTQGRHGKGAALTARQHFGAIYGQAKGRQGQSYAIVTKDLTKRKHPSVSSIQIKEQIKELYNYAWACPKLSFYIAYGVPSTGKYLNGYTPAEMARMFLEASTEKHPIPDNIIFEINFYLIMKELLK